MKGYVVTLTKVEQSVNASLRCVGLGKNFGVDITMIPARDKSNSMQTMTEYGLKLGTFNNSFSNVNAVVGNFVTQYLIWTMILKTNIPAIVLEHDAVVIDNIPDLEGKGDIINLGKPSYGKFNTKDKKGIYPMFSKNGGYIPGAHGYYVTPKGAEQLIAKAKEIGVFPCDLFLNRKNFPHIKEYYPWCIIADDSFTTIQKEKGCKAKHNFNKNFEIL